MREYPYWKAFKRRVQRVDWFAVAIAAAVVCMVLGVVLLSGARTANAPELLP